LWIAVIVTILISHLPFSGSWGEALRGSRAYEVIATPLIVLLALTECGLIAMALSATANAVQFLTALVGGMFVMIGNLLGKVHRNMWVGIRIPWTLADEDNWDKTNRFCGSTRGYSW
jgi:uncharacterized membrane protein